MVADLDFIKAIAVKNFDHFTDRLVSEGHVTTAWSSHHRFSSSVHYTRPLLLKFLLHPP